MTVTGKDKIEIIEKDPEGEEGRIKVNLSFLQMCHYLPIVELIVELGPEEQEDWTFASLVYEEEKYSIGIPTVLYKELLPIAEGKEENLLDEFLEKISSKETYLLDIVPDEALLWMYKQQEINMGNLHRWNCDCNNKLLFLTGDYSRSLCWEWSRR